MTVTLTKADLELLHELELDVPEAHLERFCHKGICSVEQCARYQRATRLRALLKRLKLQVQP